MQLTSCGVATQSWITSVGCEEMPSTGKMQGFKHGGGLQSIWVKMVSYTKQAAFQILDIILIYF